MRVVGSGQVRSAPVVRCCGLELGARVGQLAPRSGSTGRTQDVTFANLYFAGNYRTFPSVLSTGTALASGIEAAQTLLRDRGTETPLPEKIAAFRH